MLEPRSADKPALSPAEARADGDELRPERLSILDAAWKEPLAGRRLDRVRGAAAELRAHLSGGPAAQAVRTLPLARFPYPTKYAFGGAAWHPAPFVELAHRCLLVQFERRGRTMTLLFNPTDVERARATPFFAQLLERIPTLLEPLLIARPEPALEAQLNALGLSARDIDYVAFDHFHTQDLRGLFERFPRAVLLAPRAEWDAWSCVHPLQRPWYIREGRDGVDPSRVIFLDGDHQLGDGVVLARTPGHTVGNQTLFIKTDRGVWGCAENGTSADAWSPKASRIAGLRQAAAEYGFDQIANFNTPESGTDQLTSMALESVVVDRAPDAPDFLQMFPSSELVHSWIAPGLRPTHSFRAITHGEIRRALGDAPRC